MSAVQPEEWASEGNVWRAIIGAVRESIKSALDRCDIDYGYTEFRWDVPDITFFWAKDNPTCNIHVWVEGRWPSYRLHLEGAAWKDNDEGRRVKHMTGGTLLVEVTGQRTAPQVELPNKLTEELALLVDKVRQADPSSDQIYPLSPKPS